MQEYNLAIPILPSRNIEDTLAFYRRFGFDGDIWGAPHFYAILTRDTVEIHFFTKSDLDPNSTAACCYIRVLDVDEIYREFVNVGLANGGTPRIYNLENKPWGMREFSIVDPDGNLIRIGQIV